MVSALLAIGGVVYGAGVAPEAGHLEEISAFRALKVQVNGQDYYAIVDPLNQESFAMADMKEKFGGFLQVRYLGLERDMPVEETYYREYEAPRTVTDKSISLVLGEDFFAKKLVGIDYFDESLQVFEGGSIADALAWLKAGSPDEEPTVMRFALKQDADDIWQTDLMKIDGENWPLMPYLLDSYSDQVSTVPPSKWGELWEQYGRAGVVFSRNFWRNVEFGGQPLPFFIGTWSEVENELPNARGSFCLREIGTRRAIFDAAKHEIWYTQSSTLEHVCSVLSGQVFRFPVRLVGKQLKIGRIPRFDNASGDGLCSGGVITGVETYTGEELVEGLLSTGEKRQAMVRDLVMRSKQRITVKVLCTDGQERSIYVNSLLNYGG